MKAVEITTNGEGFIRTDEEHSLRSRTDKAFCLKPNSRYALMAAELPVQVVLEVVDPGDGVVSFQFAFL